MSNETQIAPIPRYLLDRESMARALSISSDTLDRMRKCGCPSITIPGTKKIVFDPGDVVAWLKNSSKGDEDIQSIAAAEAEADVVFGKSRA